MYILIYLGTVPFRMQKKKGLESTGVEAICTRSALALRCSVDGLSSFHLAVALTYWCDDLVACGLFLQLQRNYSSGANVISISVRHNADECRIRVVKPQTVRHRLDCITLELRSHHEQA